MSFKIELRHAAAQLPTRGSAGAAGYDLFAAEPALVEPGRHVMVETGVATQFPRDCYARVAPRSGLAAKNAIDVLAGVVDSDFTGTIKVILVNHGAAPFHVAVGDRVAQLIFERIYTPDLEVVDQVDKTDRGEGGFGSTGR